MFWKITANWVFDQLFTLSPLFEIQRIYCIVDTELFLGRQSISRKEKRTFRKQPKVVLNKGDRLIWAVDCRLMKIVKALSFSTKKNHNISYHSISLISRSLNFTNTFLRLKPHEINWPKIKPLNFSIIFY